MLTTKEFMNRVRDLGYSLQMETHSQFKYIDITIDDDDLLEWQKRVASISSSWEAWGILHEMEFAGDNEIELLRVIAEYLDTPLGNRENWA